MAILITGASGMLGFDTTAYFSSKYGERSIIAPNHQDLDITNGQQTETFFETKKIDSVINCAAYTNVDGAEIEKDKAYLVNVVGPRNLAACCRKKNIPLIHFSTDQVFHGDFGRPTDENDAPNPLNHYALTKWLGEKKVLSLDKGLVLRVQWIYGTKKDRFFPLMKKTEFTPAIDQLGAPTWTKKIVGIVDAMMERKATGLFHVAHDDYASWYQIYEFVREKLALSLCLIPKTTEELGLKAKRPLFSAMSNRKLLAFLGLETFGSWKESLTHFIDEKRKT